jgi:hypothetical protein
MNCCVRVVLAADQKWLYILGWQQAERVPQRRQLSRPEMRPIANLDTDQARPQSSKEFQHLSPAKFPLHNRAAIPIDAVNLKHIFRDIKTDGNRVRTKARFKNGCFGVTRASGIGPRFWGGICGFDNGFERGDERARSDSLRLKRT